MMVSRLVHICLNVRGLQLRLHSHIPKPHKGVPISLASDIYFRVPIKYHLDEPGYVAICEDIQQICGGPIQFRTRGGLEHAMLLDPLSEKEGLEETVLRNL